MGLIFLQHLYELPNTTAQLDQIVIDTITIIPGFMEMLLLFIFGVIFLGGVTRQNFKTGSADYPMWATIGSISILLVSLIATIQSGFLNITSFIIVVVLTIFCGVWLFLDRKSSEL